MLRITLLNNNEKSFLNNSIFNNVISTKFHRDIWDFGDSIVIGNRQSNEINSWEAVKRCAIEDTYIDIFTKIDSISHGPCQKESRDLNRYSVGSFVLDTDGVREELFISLKSPDTISIDDIWYYISNNISDGRDWIGEEIEYQRPINVSQQRKIQRAEKKFIQDKTPRIALVLPQDNRRFPRKGGK